MLFKILFNLFIFANIPVTDSLLDNKIIYRDVELFDLFGLEPEVTMTLPKMVAYYGYPFEVHQVTTKDGYILNNHRIPHGKHNSDNSNKMPILLFQGGYIPSDSWVSNTPDKSVGFLLADAGFDVWMLNIRGCVYMDPNQEEYWQFSFDDLVYDAIALIDDVINKTGKSKVCLLNYSLGGRTAFATLSTFPDYNEKVKAIYALAPVGNLADVREHFIIFADIAPTIISIMRIFGIYNIDLAPVWIPRELVGSFAKVCKSLMVEIFVYLLGPMDTFNVTRMPIIWAHAHGGGPEIFLLHYAQLVKNPGFHYYDWGKNGNLVRYGQETPPYYDLKKVTVPVRLYHETHGYIISDANMQFLNDNLPNVLSLTTAGYDWNHLSYLFSTDSGMFFEKLIANIKTDIGKLS